MIPSLVEIRAALETAFRLVRGDAAAIDSFDLTFEGFIKSFFAAVLAAPFYIVLLSDSHDPASLTVSLPVLVAAEGLGYVVGWLAFPVIAALLTRFLGLSSRYVQLIVAANWVAALLIALFAAVLLVGWVLPAPAASALVLSVTIGALAVQWFVIRIGLDCGNGVAAAFLVIDVLVSTIIDLALDRLFLGS